MPDFTVITAGIDWASFVTVVGSAMAGGVGVWFLKRGYHEIGGVIKKR